jgi:hypothetical protein
MAKADKRQGPLPNMTTDFDQKQKLTIIEFWNNKKICIMEPEEFSNFNRHSSLNWARIYNISIVFKMPLQSMRFKMPFQGMWFKMQIKPFNSVQNAITKHVIQNAILLHEKRVRIAQTASFFRRLPCVRVVGNTSNLDCRPRIWPSCGWDASKSHRVELLNG